MSDGAAFVIDDAFSNCYRHDGGTISAEFVDGRWRWRCETCHREYGRAPRDKSSVKPETNGAP